MAKVYNPETHTWTDSIDSSKDKDKSSGKKNPNSSKSDSLLDKSTDKKSAKGSAQAKKNAVDYYTLTGNLSYIVSNSTIKLKAGDTVYLRGLGNYLSGKYYVESVTREIAGGGYSHQANLIRPNIKKDTLKPKIEKTTSKKRSRTKTVLKRTHTVKKGDTLQKLALRYYKDASKWGKIKTANKLSGTLIRVGQKLIIP